MEKLGRSLEPGQRVKRILIYGACHAQVLRDLLLRVLPPDEFELSLLINFQLIGSGQPFPYADLPRYDAVIYSPIENHGSYNTTALREACAVVGCQSICFPWLEWHGYCPGASKGEFKGRYQWYYPQLQVLAEQFSSFDAFHDHVVEHYPDDQTIDETFALTTERLLAGEQRNATDVRISDFIAQAFRSDRLFQICDHPSLKIYQELVAQILVALQRQPVALPVNAEPQREIRTPILPRVARRLGLNFSDTDWVDDLLLACTTWDLRTYLQLYYYPGSVILGPLDNARIFSQAEPDQQSGLPAAPFARLFALPAAQAASGARMNYELLETLDRPKNAAFSHKKFAINPAEWRSTWTV